jgi:hypothetical protein
VEAKATVEFSDGREEIKLIGKPLTPGHLEMDFIDQEKNVVID